MSIFPPDAFEKSAEKAATVDYYGDLTAEERIEEDAPAKPEEKPAAPVKPVETETEEPEGDEGDDEGDENLVDKLFDEIAGLNEKLQTAMGKEAPKTEEQKDELIEAALEHEDPIVRGLAQRLHAAEERAFKERAAKHLVNINQEFDDVQKSYLVGGKPMTDEQVHAVEQFIDQHPEVARSLNVEQVTRVVFPDAIRATKSPSAKGPGDSPGDGPKVATIVDPSAAATPASKTFTPRPGETTESAVQQAARDFGWVR